MHALSLLTIPLDDPESHTLDPVLFSKPRIGMHLAEYILKGQHSSVSTDLEFQNEVGMYAERTETRYSSLYDITVK